MTKQTPNQEELDPNSLDMRIGMLRQWLNEDRITDPKKLVTNEELWHWLRVGIEAELSKARIDELGRFMDWDNWDTLDQIGNEAISVKQIMARLDELRKEPNER